LYSSGKFRKDKSDTAYQIASGLHGVGNVAVNALSDWMEIEIYRDKKHASYKFKKAVPTDVSQEKHKGDTPYATKISFKPSKEYFSTMEVDIKTLEERLRIACVNYPKLKIILRVDEKDFVIKGSEKELILDYLTKNEEVHWIELENKKKPERCQLKIAWDESGSTTPKVLSCVNLIRVHTGTHILKLNNAVKNVFATFAKKHGFDFKPEDALVGMRAYLNLSIIKTSFEAQVKVKLESKTDLSVMSNLESQLKKYLDSNPELKNELLDRFQQYRRTLQSKKVLGASGGKKRSSTKLTKLRDCKNKGGELIIGEGDSAIGGLAQVRDKKKHAILPLRGVIVNAVTKKDLLGNNEVKDIMNALGTGIESNFDIKSLRYSKVILAADADPAGHFITALLIVLFARLTPELIKRGKLYVCRTPLFGYKEKGVLVPLWSEKEVDSARKKGKQIKRFKGLGEYSPKDLKVFTLNEDTRKLIKVEWSDKYERVFELMSSSEEKKKLMIGTWKL
ncbi:MAG: hypothetical protein KAS32_16235, partial [Candidatus Peribacteraceae bacterium]|nr:hypothetical protein [Candidatus Peribacteraceae bacterium]